MGRNKLIFKNRVKVVWMKFPSGEIQSFLLSEDNYKQKWDRILKAGAKEIPDPFRKGAPLGGYKYEG
jgi:vancomycin permeability regulator SanA